ncbi:nuclear transport factor 2 family protein [Dactylosporangium sp. NPDC005572]|uniref:nuclear transport factor 2 family protein n=1 Tax=Dactylosporangium sp. NPDC005572 TaxID=3156889 RepID=UPI0033B04011
MTRTRRAATALVLFAGLTIGLPAAPAPALAAPVTVDTLARDVARVESVREVKDLQRTYAQLHQYGRFADMAALFADDGALVWGTQGLAADAPVTGRAAVESWLVTDAGTMDGIRPGSLHTEINDNPVVSLSTDGLSAKGRWGVMRFKGSGAGEARVDGGIYENEYVLRDGRWQISLLRYYPQYTGTYAAGWRSINGQSLPVVPHHFTPVSAGIPIPPPEGDAPPATATAEQLATRINRLGDEDAVRNLQHTYGYYVDRRMWTDVTELFTADATYTIDNVGTYTGPAGVRQAMERMGPEGLTQGILNDHPLWDTIVDVNPNGQEATARGIELGLVGDANTRAASWEFSVFRNLFVKDDGVWKLKEVSLTPLVVAGYTAGWGSGGVAPVPSGVPAFLDVDGRSAQAVPGTAGQTDLAELKRRLDRAQGFDGVENVSSAYGYLLDDLLCSTMAATHATNAHKMSAFTGWYFGVERITQACQRNFGGGNPATLRSSISYHWRPQPVVLMSQDGRSAQLQVKLWQPTTSNFSAGIIRGAYYHDSFVVENGVWKLWSLTVDEHYWTMTNWAGGWSAANPRSPTAPNPPGGPLLQTYPPDVTMVSVGVREEGFQGGIGRYVAWPEIHKMWFDFRNPVSGRVPGSTVTDGSINYWPTGCVPCEAQPAWKFGANGYQATPTGPTAVTATAAPTAWGTAATVTVGVAAGPGEAVNGTVVLREGGTVRGSATLSGTGSVTFTLPVGLSGGTHTMTASFLGSDHLNPGRKTFPVTVNLPPAWSASTVYNSGDKVTHDGKVYVATWWTRSQAPGGSPTGAWQELALTEDGTAVWTPSRIFDTGDVVTYQGKRWRALWWTRNETPGTPYGSWEELAPQPADGTPAAWTPTTVYTAGNRVTHAGHVYEAQWWTRNQEPGAANGPWKLIS